MTGRSIIMDESEARALDYLWAAGCSTIPPNNAGMEVTEDLHQSKFMPIQFEHLGESFTISMAYNKLEHWPFINVRSKTLRRSDVWTVMKHSVQNPCGEIPYYVFLIGDEEVLRRDLLMVSLMR